MTIVCAVEIISQRVKSVDISIVSMKCERQLDKPVLQNCD